MFRHVRHVEHSEDGAQIHESESEPEPEPRSKSSSSIESQRWVWGLAPTYHLVEKVEEDVEGALMDYSYSDPNKNAGGCTGRRFILKESWREEDQVAEYDFLNALGDVRNEGGLEGEGGMLVGYDDNADDDKFNTRSLRPTLVCAAEQALPPQSPSPMSMSSDSAEEEDLVLPTPAVFPLSNINNDYKARIQTRLVREEFGPTIDQWRYPAELLEALLDIVKGELFWLRCMNAVNVFSQRSRHCSM